MRNKCIKNIILIKLKKLKYMTFLFLLYNFYLTLLINLMSHVLI